LVRPVLEDATLIPSRTQIILDTEAIAAVRTAVRSQVLGEPMAMPLPGALRHEFRNAYFCQEVLAVNEREARILVELGIHDPEILGTMREPSPTDRGFAARRGVLFVGSLHAADTPNVDSLCWFVDQVLPLIEEELGAETRLTVAGYLAPGLDLERIGQHVRVTLLGPVPDLIPLYDAHRVFVAPTRFAAGTPYKVYEAASFGLPVVATELLRGQLDWTEGAELLAAPADDPAAFAAKVVMLYRSADLWGTVRDAALARLRRENGWDQFSLIIESRLSQRAGGIGVRAAE
ncbi:MAG: glycosyltransferase family 4 protein, partial [Pseudomonadota bacterium]|nr:glycosyltransferase family 4 protein [Pseudomonadota bacterium]MDQ2803299.1 glycosyltransferase family 4 protein [Pseudomonadota bacterium]